MMQGAEKKTITRRELRQFGVGLGIFFAMIGAGLLWNNLYAGYAVLLAGTLLAMALWADWPGMRTFYETWRILGSIIGNVMAQVFLTFFYLLLLTPIALIGRACGQRFVERGFRKEQETYWVACTGMATRQTYKKQS